MKTFKLATFALLLLGSTWVFATEQISVAPVPVMTSWFDYMIGSYNNLPMQELPSQYGGGRIMTYHARRTSSSLRKVYFTYIDDSGQMLPTLDPWQDVDRYMGYPAVVVDKDLGKAFYSWHEASDADELLEVASFYENNPLSNPGIYSPVQNVFDPPDTPSLPEGYEFIWPSVRTGPSPLTGMRRIYILGRNHYNGDDGPCSNVLLARADFNEAMLEEMEPLSWSYSTIPELDDWCVSNDQVSRRMFGAFEVADDGRIYYAGYHTAWNPETYELAAEPELDVFVCDDYGEGVWQRYSISSTIPSYNPYNSTQMIHAFNNDEGPVPDADIYYRIMNSGHFNAVIDSRGKLHVPGVWTLWIDGVAYPGQFNTIKEYIFDPATNSFAIHEIFPVAGTSNDDSWWMPWDEDGDLEADGWPDTSPQPSFINHFPFCHWNEEDGLGNMYFHYNYVRLTEDDGSGTMACLWQDSQKARYYHLSPTEYPQYAAYQSVPEIYITPSYDRGQTWQEPIVLSSVANPELDGVTPMWVYPSSRFTDLSATSETIQKRLYMMFLDDDYWGPVLPPAHGISSGIVMYMALDLEAPVATNDPVIPHVSILELQQNYPNPFNPDTTIRYSLNETAPVSLGIYNLKGQLVKKLVNEVQEKGTHQMEWNGLDQDSRPVSGGIYLYRLSSGQHFSTKRMVLIK